MFGVCVALLSAALALTGVSGKQKQPFFDPKCFDTDCSWTWDTPSPGYQFCERIVYNNSLINVCPNPFSPPSDPNQRPDKAEEVQVTDFNKLIRSSQDPDTFEQYTCLNVTYKIRETVASKVKGIQLSVLGLDYPDMNLNFCLNLNFSVQLEYYAVENRVFSMECFCGLKPGSEYRVTVRTLPVDPSPADPDDTKVQRNHTPLHCKDPSKTNDVRCQKSKEAVWTPECFVVDQPISAGLYDILEVKLDVAPVDYQFDQYWVFIYKYVPTSPILIGGPPVLPKANLSRDDAVEWMCAQEPVLAVTHRFNISTLDKSLDTEYIAKVVPKPSVNQCLDAEGGEELCKTTCSSPFSLIADPCKRNPCGDAAIGQCISQEESYRCDCIPGYKEWNQTCVVDPCVMRADNGQNLVPQCTNGECQYIHTSPQLDYYCTCNEGFEYLKVPKRCEANPCYVREDTGLTVCGPHGQCEKNLTDEQVSHRCTCQDGYTFEPGHEEECRKETSLGIIAIAIASCLAGLLLCALAVFLYRRRNPPPLPDVRPPGPPRVLDRFGYRRVLPIYSDDHPGHRKVIHSFCRFLKEHCKCEVSLLDWQKSVAPTVCMWLDAEIHKADIVLLICSKGTGEKYKDKSRQKVIPSSDGIYGDVFLQALTLLDAHFGRNDACDKFVVCYFDYSSEDDIPNSFKPFAKYRLMKCMDNLFLRIHDKVKDSPGSSRRVQQLEEANYLNLDMGKPLHAAIEDMKELIKKEPKWHQKYNKGNGTRKAPVEPAKPSQSQEPLLHSLSPQISNDSAYDSTDVCNDFFKDSASTSSRCSSIGSDYERSLQQLQSKPVNRDVAVEMPHYQNIYNASAFLFDNDRRLAIGKEPGDPHQSDGFYSNFQDISEMQDIPNRQARAGSSCV